VFHALPWRKYGKFFQVPYLDSKNFHNGMAFLRAFSDLFDLMRTVYYVFIIQEASSESLPEEDGKIL